MSFTALVNAQENAPTHQCNHSNAPAHECNHHCNNHNVYSAETRAMMEADRMAADLKLTEQEKQQVLELYKKIEAEKDANKANMEKQRKEHDAALEKIIGKDKMAILKEKRAHDFSHATCPNEKGHKASKPLPAPTQASDRK